MKIAPINLQSDAIRGSRTHPLLVGLALLPPRLRKPVGVVQRSLQKTDARHIYPPASTFHITIKPVGTVGVQVERRNLDEIKGRFRRVVSRFQAFEVALDGLAVFPDVVYAKVTDGSSEIIELNKALAESLGKFAISGEYERDRMIQHVTLAIFTNPSASKLLAQVRRADRLMIGRATLNQVYLVTANLHLYYGDESVRANAFQKVEVFRLKTS